MLYEVKSGFPEGQVFEKEDESLPFADAANPGVYQDLIATATKVLGVAPADFETAVRDLVAAGCKVTFRPDEAEKRALIGS